MSVVAQSSQSEITKQGLLASELELIKFKRCPLWRDKVATRDGRDAKSLLFVDHHLTFETKSPQS